MATTLSSSQLDTLLRQAGFTGTAAATMKAIIYAESSGDPTAHNYTPATGDDSYGLAQVNMLGALGPSRRSQLGLTSNQQLLDPLTNLRAAFAISAGGTNFGPWSTFKSGAYKQFLAGGIDPPGDWGPSPIGPPLPVPWGGANPVDAVGEQIAAAFGAAVDPFVTGLRRLSIIGVVVAAGAALVVAGAWRGVKAGSS